MRIILCSDHNLVSLKAAVEDYKGRHCQGDSHTARARAYDIKYFYQFVTARKPAPYIVETSQQDVRDFIEDRLSIGEAPATVARRHSTIHQFFDELARRYPQFENPCDGVKAPQLEQSRPKKLSEEQLLSLQQEVTDFKTARANLWVELGFVCGCRVSDLVSCTVGQVNLKEGVIRNLVRKGRRVMDLPFGIDTSKAIETYLQYRHKALVRSVWRFDSLPEAVKLRYPLFVSCYGKSKKDRMRPDDWRVNPKTIYTTIRDLGEKAGFKVHPHMLRHSFAHRLLEMTGDIRFVAQAMGHTDLKTTMRYTERKIETLQEIINRPEFYKRRAA